MGKTYVQQRQLSGAVAFYAQMSSNVNVPDGTTTDAEFDTEVYDHGGNFNTGTYTFTAPYKGIYLFDASIRFSTIDDTRFAAINLATSNTALGASGVMGGFVESVATNDFVYPSVHANIELDAGDTVKVTVTHNNGTTETVDTNDTYTFFMGCLLTRLD